jgi:hypothetical protein
LRTVGVARLKTEASTHAFQNSVVESHTPRRLRIASRIFSSERFVS